MYPGPASRPPVGALGRGALSAASRRRCSERGSFSDVRASVPPTEPRAHLELQWQPSHRPQGTPRSSLATPEDLHHTSVRLQTLSHKSVPKSEAALCYHSLTPVQGPRNVGAHSGQQYAQIAPGKAFRRSEAETLHGRNAQQRVERGNQEKKGSPAVSLGTNWQQNISYML